jgi:hypothetical protein
MWLDFWGVRVGDDDQLFNLISAVAAGDAERGDVVAELRKQGVDALDLLVAVLARAGRPERPGARARPLDPQRLIGPADPERARRAVHRVPRLPFVLRGTLYDPADIVRFNGQELHTIAAPGRDHLIVIDDAALMNNWLQMAYFSDSYHPNKVVGVRGSTGSGELGTTDFGIGRGAPGGIGSPEGPVVIGSSGHSPGLGGPPRAIFYEDVDYGGASIELVAGLAYDDLTEVHHGVLGLGGDWNDYISSIQTSIPLYAGLWEHVHQGGSSFACFGGSLDLSSAGWNDRASSVACMPIGWPN